MVNLDSARFPRSRTTSPTSPPSPSSPSSPSSPPFPHSAPLTSS
ncbi:MAG TPA: hypothetical protein V6D25_27595 [Leptolyngbyaceae cyanobacterium]